MKTAIYILIIAWGASAIALFTDVFGYTASLTLFGRSGAVLTLCAAILEYSISIKGQNSSQGSTGAISIGGLGAQILRTDAEKRAQYFAHISVVLGTFIWGFGDLVTRLTNI